MKFLDADVKRPLASVSSIVDKGNIVARGEHEHWPEDSNEQGEWRVCGVGGRTSGCENEKREVRRAAHE